MNYLTKLRIFSKTTAARLSLSYLMIIMLMSIFFSFVIYNTSTHDLGRPPHPDDNRGFFMDGSQQQFNFNNFFQQRISEAQHALLIHLILLNLFVLIGGAVLSYYLARRTLRPIERNMESQAQFVSDASHELRTPLTALQTSNEVALRGGNLSQKEIKEILSQNVTDVLKLRSLTDNLLNLARIDNASMEMKQVDLSDVVADALNNVIASASHKKIAVEDDVPKISIMANRASIAQAVTTILDNAIKYSPEKSTVYIDGGKNKNNIWLSIKDNGAGIKAVHLPHIFDRFYRVDESRNKQENDGYGIGLSLAKKIIEQHHGHIEVESHLGKGSTFTIKLPATT